VKRVLEKKKEKSMKKMILPVTALLLAIGSAQSILAVGETDLPDAGSSVFLLAIGLAGIGAMIRKFK